MIKNDKQYRISIKKHEEFVNSLESIRSSDKTEILKKIMANSIISQIKTFEREIAEYDQLKKDKPGVIVVNFDELPEALIKARIIRGLTQSDLAKRVGLKEQQIQRYESGNYESASFDRLRCIAKSMDVYFESTRLILKQEQLEVGGYDPIFIRRATNKLQSRKSLLAV